MVRPQVSPHERLYADIADQAKHDPQVLAEIMAEVDPIAWMDWIELKTEKGEPIEFKEHAPLEQVYLDMHPNQDNQKGSQIGMTETVINKILWYSDYHNVTTIYTMPTATHVQKFSQSRFSPVVKGNLYLRRRMGRTVDNVQLKRIGNSWIHFGGAQKEAQAISTPADILVHDEYDFSDIDVLDAYGKRIGASKRGWVWRFSTPTLPGYGINALFEQTDQRHWLVRCERCNTWQSISYEANIKRNKRTGKWYFGCHKCDKLLKRRNGIWVAYHPDRATDTQYDNKGRLVEPASGSRGYFINPLTFTYVTAESRVKAREKAEKSKRPTAIKNFHNFDLGVPYASGESLITEEIIIRHMRLDYPLEGFNVMGVDQGDNKHWIVKKVLPGGMMPVIDFGVTESWDVVRRKFAEWDCAIGVTDALPNKDNARSLVKTGHRKWWMSYYKEQHEDVRARHEVSGEETEGDRRTKKIFGRSHKETQALLVDRTESLDYSASAWIDGRTYLVGDKTSIGERNLEFIQHIVAMKRDIVENSKGIAMAVWVKLGADHWRHADNFATVGAQLKKPRGSVADIEVMGSLVNGVNMPAGASDMTSLWLPTSISGDPNFRDFM